MCCCVAVILQLLWLRHGDSSRFRRKGNVRGWQPLHEDWWRVKIVTEVTRACVCVCMYNSDV
jgi:hypothetical protein